MSKLGFPLLDADARSVVRRASPIERAPLEAKARVLARVEAAGASSGGQDGSASGRGPAGHVPSEPRLSGASLPLAIVVAFALGGGLGALVMHRLERAPAPIEGTHLRSTDRELPGTPAEVPSVQPATASVQRVDVQPAPNREAPATARPEPLQPASARERPVPAALASSSRGLSSDAPDPVADERTLLDVARVAVEREDGAAALAATEEHARKYPRGVLVQEREAIAVRALVLLGRTDEAHARVDRFRERFPDSLLLPALESSTGVQPTP